MPSSNSDPHQMNLSDEDLDRIVRGVTANLRAEIEALVRTAKTPGRPSRGINMERTLMEADRALAKTFGSAGRIGRHGEPSVIPPSRPKRLVFRMAGHRESTSHLAEFNSARVTSQHRTKEKPASASRVPK